MRSNPLKAKLRTGEQIYGCWVTLAHPLIPEILAPAKFDYLVLDMEHSSLELNDILPMIISTEACGMIPLVRVGENDPNLIKRIMDAGSYGVIVANVKSRAEADAAVNAVRYPPEGTRGVGLYRAQGFGKTFEEYKRWNRDESLVVIQIEHIDAVRDIESILAAPGIDAFMIGPYDLSGSMGKPGAFNDPDVEAALQRVLAVAREKKVPAGFHSVSSSPEEAARRRGEGYRMLAFSVDAIFLGDAAIQAMDRLLTNP